VKRDSGAKEIERETPLRGRNKDESSEEESGIAKDEDFL